MPQQFMDLLRDCMGLMKNEIFFPNFQINTNTYCDLINYYRYSCRMMAPEELNPFYWPQLFLVSDQDLNPSEYPPLMNLSRTLLDSSQIYVIFNTFYLFLWVGKDTDPFFIYELFETDD